MTIDNPTQLAHKPNFINSEFVNAVEFFTATKETITKDYVLDIVNKFPTPLITSLINKTLLKL